MLEYCCVVYKWMGRGWTQEIEWLRIQGQEKTYAWNGKYWVDFLNHMARKEWELVAATPLGSGDTVVGAVAYFKRPVKSYKAPED